MIVHGKTNGAFQVRSGEGTKNGEIAREPRPGIL